jgi:hypothetical protein
VTGYQRFRGPCYHHLQGDVNGGRKGTGEREGRSAKFSLLNRFRPKFGIHTRVYPKVSRLAAWTENCKWYSSLPLGAVVSLFCKSV